MNRSFAIFTPAKTLAGMFVKRKRGDKSRTCIERDAEHLQVTLQKTVFTRSSVNQDEGHVELYSLSVYRNGKVCLVYLFSIHAPACTAQEHFIYIISASVYV